MEKLTLKQLEEMKPHTIFASGNTMLEHPWKRDLQVGVKWIATRGGIHDWAIYFTGNLKAPDKDVADFGDKLHDMKKVVELVPADDSALEMYRH